MLRRCEAVNLHAAFHNICLSMTHQVSTAHVDSLNY